MIRRVIVKRVLLGIFLLAIAVVAASLAVLSSARVELTESGIHKSLRIPIGTKSIKFPLYTGTGDKAFIPGYMAGPIVRRKRDGSWSAKWFCQNQTHSTTGTAAAIRIDCAGKSQLFSLETAPVPAAVGPMPDKLLVISDLEGNSAFLDSALRKLEVVDASGHWQFGQGHLVVLGDSVDRGRDVFAVLWRLHDLAAQAHAAGGAVHLVLGNHDQYMLRNVVTKAHPAHRYAAMKLGGYAQAFGPDTVIGAWLREQPVVLKLGSVLFTHGGISPQVVASGLSIRQLNDGMRSYWPMSQQDLPQTPELDAVFGQTGVTQYRGYFREKKGSYPAASQDDVDGILAHFNASGIVVAHTVVDGVKRLHDGKVIAVDVNDDEARPEILRYDEGVASVVNIGVPRALDSHQPARMREFSLFDTRDRQLLTSMFKVSRSLAGVPFPY